MTDLARRMIRASHVGYGVVAALILLATAIKGYWTVFFPFLLVVGLWVWWVRTHPPEFR